MPDERPFTLRQIDQARGDLYALQDDLDFIKLQLARLPTRYEVWCAAMLGMPGGAVAAVTLIERSHGPASKLAGWPIGSPSPRWRPASRWHRALLQPASIGRERSRRSVQRQHPCRSRAARAARAPAIREITSYRSPAADSIRSRVFSARRSLAKVRDRVERKSCGR